MKKIMNLHSLKEQIIIALDKKSIPEIHQLLTLLGDHIKFVKVGMELYYNEGPTLIKELKKRKLKVFLDLKIHDIPNTAFYAAKALTSLGVDIINVHANGGIEMMSAARQGMLEALKESTQIAPPLIVAVTHLTSINEEILHNELGITRSLNESVLHYAKLAKEAKLDGVVCSPLEVKQIKENIGHDFICITPGIRPRDSFQNDQKRFTTPLEAIRNGANYLVIGRAITQAQDPLKAYKQIQGEILNHE